MLYTPFAGIIDEVGVYNRALLPTEIAAIAGYGSAGRAGKLGNAGDGVYVIGDAPGNTIGGTTAASRNVLSGNLSDGVETNAPNTLVQNNYVGTDVTGLVAVGNVSYGVILQNDGDTVRDNLITGNLGGGILDYNGTSGNASPVRHPHRRQHHRPGGRRHSPRCGNVGYGIYLALIAATSRSAAAPPPTATSSAGTSASASSPTATRPG